MDLPEVSGEAVTVYCYADWDLRLSWSVLCQRRSLILCPLVLCPISLIPDHQFNSNKTVTTLDVVQFTLELIHCILKVMVIMHLSRDTI